MGTIACGNGATNPKTDFYYDATVVALNSVNNTFTVRHTIWCVNRGTTGAYSNYTGAQRAYFGGGEVLNHVANPFLPIGQATGERWRHTTDIVYGADANGYYNGGSPVSLSESAAWHTTSLSASGSITIPRVARRPYGPTSPALDQATQTSLRYNATPRADNGGSAVTGRQVQYATTNTFLSPTTLTPGSLTNVGITGLAARTVFYVRSREQNAIGWGDWSPTVSLATVDVPGEPSVNVTAKTSTTISAAVVDPAYVGGGITARLTQLSKVSDFAAITASSSSATPGFVGGDGVTRATQFYLRARVTNSTGVSPWGPVTTVTTDAVPPTAPTGYVVSDLASTTAYLSLPAVADNGGTPLTDLRVQINTSASTTGATVVTVGGYRAPFLQGLTPGGTYFARMAVANSGTGGGWSPYGAWISFTMKNNVPTPPLSLAAGSISYTDAALSWTAPADDLGSTRTGYSLRVATNPAFSAGLQIIPLSATALSRLVDGLLPGTTFYAQIWSTTSGGFGSYSDIISFTTLGVAPTPSAMWHRLPTIGWKPGILWMKIPAVGWRTGTLWQKLPGIGWVHG